MAKIDVTIPTGDGSCSATLHLPGDGEARPGVIMYPDAGGARDTFRQMADRLAEEGYAVLVPDVYYRVAPVPPFSMETVFTDPGERKRLMDLVHSLTPDLVKRDAEAFSAFLADRGDVRSGPIGTTGYCMGGRISLTVAGHLGERVGAAASFHGGNLAVADDPGSPHHLANQVRAVVYVGAAENDGSFGPDQRERLHDAYEAAGVRHSIEDYPAAHGFAVPDNPPYDESAAERHWQAMTDLYAQTLQA
jgi:carboxymethylenebutenolidase